MGVAASDAWEPHTSSSRGHSAAGCAAPTGAVAPLTAAGRPSPRLWTGVSAGDRDDHSASIACCWAAGKAVEVQLRGKACSGSVPASLRDSSCTCAWGVARANALSCGMYWRVAPRQRGLAAIRALRALLATTQSSPVPEQRPVREAWGFQAVAHRGGHFQRAGAPASSAAASGARQIQLAPEALRMARAEATAPESQGGACRGWRPRRSLAAAGKSSVARGAQAAPTGTRRRPHPATPAARARWRLRRRAAGRPL